jgi:hypothetical protein
VPRTTARSKKRGCAKRVEKMVGLLWRHPLTDAGEKKKKNRGPRKHKPKGRPKKRKQSFEFKFCPTQLSASLKLRSLQEAVLWVLGIQFVVWGTLSSGFVANKPANFHALGCDNVEQVWITLVDCLDAGMYASLASSLPSLTHMQVCCSEHRLSSIRRILLRFLGISLFYSIAQHSR